MKALTQHSDRPSPVTLQSPLKQFLSFSFTYAQLFKRPKWSKALQSALHHNYHFMNYSLDKLFIENN